MKKPINYQETKSDFQQGDLVYIRAIIEKPPNTFGDAYIVIESKHKNKDYARIVMNQIFLRRSRLNTIIRILNKFFRWIYG